LNKVEAAHGYLSQDGIKEGVEVFPKATESIADAAKQPLRHLHVTGVLLSRLGQYRPQLNTQTDTVSILYTVEVQATTWGYTSISHPKG